MQSLDRIVWLDFLLFVDYTSKESGFFVLKTMFSLALFPTWQDTFLLVRLLEGGASYVIRIYTKQKTGGV
jgi:hypothetical protein